MRYLSFAFMFLLAVLIGPVLPCARAQTLVTSVQIPGTVQGSIVVSNSSIALSTANVVMAPKSAAFPTAALTTFWFMSEAASNVTYMCIGGGTATATAGCLLLPPRVPVQITFPAPGGGITQVAPTFYSASGATIDFWN